MRDTEYCNALYLMQCIQNHYKANCNMTINNTTVILKINFTDIPLSTTFVFEYADSFEEIYTTLLEYIRYKIEEWIKLKTIRTELCNEEKKNN